MQELTQWLDAQNINYSVIDNEVVDIPDFGKMFLADLSGVDTIFKGKDDKEWYYTIHGFRYGS